MGIRREEKRKCEINLEDSIVAQYKFEKRNGVGKGRRKQTIGETI